MISMQQNHLEFGKGKEISKASVNSPLLSDYMNYREFLADFYRFKRQASKGALRPYNYAVFSAAANIKSPNYLKMIIEGKRNLSDEMIGKFGKALGFMKEQTEEFRFLVHFTQASDPAERNLYLKKLSEHRIAGKLKSGEIDRKTFEKLPNWIGWIIYAMIDQEGVSYDITTLESLLRGKASQEEIREAVESMIASGEITRDTVSGELRKARNLIDSPEDIPVALIRKLQSQLMYLGLESLYQDQPQDREFGSLTLALTKSEFEEIKFKLRQMRKAMHKDNSIARMKTKGERVYQLNIQLFPVTNQVAGLNLAAKAVDSLKSPDLILKSRIDVVEASFAEPASDAVLNSPLEAEPAQVAGENKAEEAPGAVVKVDTQLNMQPNSPKDSEKENRTNVSSLAASAASAADLFR